MLPLLAAAAATPLRACLSNEEAPSEGQLWQCCKCAMSEQHLPCIMLVGA